jgi:ABC-type Fe3+/spermidine/putrescine transport system ATPase subunit
VSEFIGVSNLLRVEVVRLPSTPDDPFVLVRQASHQFRCQLAPNVTVQVSQQALVSIRPEKLTLHREMIDGGPNVWQGDVVAAAYFGDHREYELDVDGQRLKVTTPVEVVAEKGQRLLIACDPAEVLLLPEGVS